jgi:hypothetical protein
MYAHKLSLSLSLSLRSALSLCLYAGEYEKANHLSYAIGLLMRDLPAKVF